MAHLRLVNHRIAELVALEAELNTGFSAAHLRSRRTSARNCPCCIPYYDLHRNDLSLLYKGAASIIFMGVSIPFLRGSHR